VNLEGAVEGEREAGKRIRSSKRQRNIDQKVRYHSDCIFDSKLSSVCRELMESVREKLRA
jgi:hypothetical protein